MREVVDKCCDCDKCIECLHVYWSTTAYFCIERTYNVCLQPAAHRNISNIYPLLLSRAFKSTVPARSAIQILAEKQNNIDLDNIEVIRAVKMPLHHKVVTSSSAAVCSRLTCYRGFFWSSVSVNLISLISLFVNISNLE